MYDEAKISYFVLCGDHNLNTGMHRPVFALEPESVALSLASKTSMAIKKR